MRPARPGGWRAGALATALLAGCPAPADLADYDATCAVDEDCAVVVVDGYCGACDRFGALSDEAAPTFLEDQATYTAWRADHPCRSVILPGCATITADQTTASCGDDGLCRTDEAAVTPPRTSATA